MYNVNGIDIHTYIYMHLSVCTFSYWTPIDLLINYTLTIRQAARFRIRMKFNAIALFTHSDCQLKTKVMHALTVMDKRTGNFCGTRQKIASIYGIIWFCDFRVSPEIILNWRDVEYRSYYIRVYFFSNLIFDLEG